MSFFYRYAAPNGAKGKSIYRFHRCDTFHCVGTSGIFFKNLIIMATKINVKNTAFMISLAGPSRFEPHCHSGSLCQFAGKPIALMSIVGNSANSDFSFCVKELLGETLLAPVRSSALAGVIDRRLTT